VAGLLSLSACGGGGDSVATFDVSVIVGGQPVSGVVIQPGAPQNVAIIAGQSLELDASEPVQWVLDVGGTTIASNGTTVSYQGVDITQTALSASRIAIDTFAQFQLLSPVAITLRAISTFDAAQVATVNVLITN
jgi:hypothetical protein